jgi:putative restriction endonuclease
LHDAQLSQALCIQKSTIENHQSSIDPLPQHAVSGNDDPRNGLALTPDAHWMFDAGLWAAIPKGDEFLIHVAKPRFTESSPHGRLLADLHLRPLHFHDHARLRPEAAHLAWHRTRHRI